MTLTEFLLARIAEDERMALTALTSAAHVDGGVSWWWVRFGDNSLTWEASPVPPARVLRECQAKRRIVELHTAAVRALGEGLSATSRQAVQALAAVYSDHQDYDPAWRP